MKHLAAFLLILYAANMDAQEYRLVFDSSTVPELYQTTRVWLQQKTGSQYTDVQGRYRLATKDGALRDNVLSYTDEDILKTNGDFQFTATINGQNIPLHLKVPVLSDIRFNFYTDSIKPILNFYVNVEGIFSTGKILPLTETQLILFSSTGTMQGMEWAAPANEPFDSVTFTAVSRTNPSIRKTITVFRKKLSDPKDAENYQERRSR